MNYDALFFSRGRKTSEVAIIGVGGFNHSLFVYGSRNERLSIRILCDRDVRTGVEAFRSIGIAEDQVVHCTTEEEGLRAYRAGRHLVFDDVRVAMTMPFDIAVEGTGNPEASAVHVCAAIENNKHVVMVTKESDSVVGPILSAKARERGLIYSLAEGDQPALLIGLVSWAKAAGLSILSIGKSSEYDFVYDQFNSGMHVMDTTLPIEDFNTVWNLGDDTEDTLKKRHEMLSGFSQRALPDLCEMGIVCNHLPEFHPDVPALHFPVARTLEIPDVMCPHEMGGLMAGRKRIDVVNSLRRIDEQSMEGGVFVVVECDDEGTWQLLLEKGVPISRNRKTALIYYPAHYLGFEAVFSVLSVCLLGVPSGSPEPKPRYDLAARANKSLQAGTLLSAQGHHHIIDGFEGLLVPARRISDNTHLPYYLADGMTLTTDIQPGTMLTAEMLQPPESAILWDLRREQDALFFGAEVD